MEARVACVSVLNMSSLAFNAVLETDRSSGPRAP
jgi:hypothetical protein